jgi:hypothetical protein
MLQSKKKMSIYYFSLKFSRFAFVAPRSEEPQEVFGVVEADPVGEGVLVGEGVFVGEGLFVGERLGERLGVCEREGDADLVG